MIWFHVLNCIKQNAGKDRQQPQSDQQRLIDTERKLAAYQRKCKQLQVLLTELTNH